jgi:hypothetical protein
MTLDFTRLVRASNSRSLMWAAFPCPALSVVRRAPAPALDSQVSLPLFPETRRG